jgi:amidase
MSGSDISTNSNGKTPRWQEVAERRKEEIKSGISQYFAPAELLKDQNSINLPQKSGVLSERELELTGLTATKLLPLIHNGTYTAVEVTTAFCKRAAIAHQAVG